MSKETPGSGFLKCVMCGKPYAEHSIGPCDIFGDGVIYGDPPISPEGTGICINCGGPSPRRKNGEFYNLYCSDRCRRAYTRKQRQERNRK